MYVSLFTFCISAKSDPATYSMWVHVEVLSLLGFFVTIAEPLRLSVKILYVATFLKMEIVNPSKIKPNI